MLSKITKKSFLLDFACKGICFWRKNKHSESFFEEKVEKSQFCFFSVA